MASIIVDEAEDNMAVDQQATKLDADRVAAVDSTAQAAEIVLLADHLRDAIFRVDSADLQLPEALGGVLVAGMGGSGIGARLAAAIVGDRARRPIGVCAGYALPSWVGPDTLVLCSSYSGATEETLAAYEHAGRIGCPRVVATTGGPLAELARRDGVPVVPLPAGFQPRAAVGYATVVALEVAVAAGAAPDLRAELDGAADLVARLAAEWGPDGSPESEAKLLAVALDGHVPILAGAELTAPVAYRWKTQLNENSKLHAFAGELPEIDHNEIVGWKASSRYGRFAAILFDDPETHPRTRARIGLTAELIGEDAGVVRIIGPHGSSRAERLLSLVLLGDLVSLYLAVLRDADPVEIDVLHELKARLAAI